MMTQKRLGQILSQVQFNDWAFFYDVMGEGWFIQVRFWALDNERAGMKPTLQQGRKWYVSKFATPAEVVQTAFLAVLTALEHEAREQFTYKGAAILGPHLDLDGLVDAAGQTVHREPVAA